ncbi:MAG: hypothetical protein CEE38_14485 [Planctomycetes bacterium B3_Pla]|nr:MAG: hypothetical protein CEE38_14485 [Planctomycetes bacterium B3_Pla]
MKFSFYLFNVVVICLLSSQAVGLAPIGPAASDLEKGQVAIGFDYSDGEAELVGKLLGLEIEAESEFDSYLGKIRFGVLDGLEIFGRIGSAEVDGSSGIAGGIGMKARLAESENIDWGFAGQITWAGYEDDGYEPAFGYLWHEEADFYTVQLALGPVFKGGGFRFYGGPMLVWLEGDGDLDVIGGPLPGRFPFELEKELEVGGYVGLSVDLFDGSGEDQAASCDLNVEYQFGKDWDLLGLGVSLKF